MVQSQELKRYFYLFLRWWWLIVLCAALGAGAAYAYSLQITPVYSATATLRVQIGASSTDARNVYYIEPLANAHSQMLTGRPVMRAVVDRLRMSMAPEELAGMIKVQQVPEAGLIRLSVTHIDPVQAAQIANAVAEAYIAYTEALQQGRYAEYLDGVQAQMVEMAALIESTSAAIAALGTPVTNQEQAELARLETTLAGYRNTHAMLWNNYEDMRLTATLSSDSVVLFEPAEAPQAPDGTGTRQNTLLAGAVGAMLAVGVAFLVEYLDETLKTPDDIREALDLNTLGVIGRLGRGEGERIVAEHPRSPVSEAYRRLRTNVRFTSLDAPLRTLLVTSPGVTEGKSITVANLATAMAQAGLKVAVVDADLRRPRQHKMFNLASSQGLTQSLLDGRLNGNVCPVQDTEGLAVLPSGELPPNPAELLGSQRMHALLEELTAHADVVLVDSPPLLPVTDAAVLAQNVDGVLLVIDAGRTRRSAAQQAVESLRQVGAHLLGAVLNGVPTRGRGRYYYYYYYHDQHEYGEEGRKRVRRRGGGKRRAAHRQEERDPTLRPADPTPRRAAAPPVAEHDPTPRPADRTPRPAAPGPAAAPGPDDDPRRTRRLRLAGPQQESPRADPRRPADRTPRPADDDRKTAPLGTRPLEPLQARDPEPGSRRRPEPRTAPEPGVPDPGVPEPEPAAVEPGPRTAPEPGAPEPEPAAAGDDALAASRDWMEYARFWVRPARDAQEDRDS
jgi:succinoglycan biosynthesis transport protein ExoP